ncbi:MAG: GTPase domain-containing protein [Myxococcales bacterium]|nr:GTPase domain-containing protein [Myxococcales bacterium]
MYDGPAGAGKTTNVRVLHETLLSARSGALCSPGSTQRRTEFFDWRAFDGGFLGRHPVRIHIVAVPGQWSHRERRRLLLRSADAVCFVADASAPVALQARMMKSLLGMQPNMAAKLVLQLNKTDLSTASSTRDFVAELGAPPGTPVVQATAHENSGVAHTFSMATRLATSSVRDTVANMDLHSVSVAMSMTPEELYEEIQALESLSWRGTDHDADNSWSND